MVVFITKNKPYEAIEEIEKIKDKKEEMSLIVKVVLFNFLYRMRKHDEALKHDIKKKNQMFLDNVEIPLESTYLFLLSAAFQLNILLFSEKEPQKKPQCFFYKENDQEILTLTFLIDMRKRLRILTKENVEYQKDKQEADIREAQLEKKLAELKEKEIENQIKYDKLARTYKSSIQVNTILFERLEDLVINLENIKKRPEKTRKFKFSNKSQLVTNLNYMHKKEKELMIMHENEEKEGIFDPIKEMKNILKSVSSKLKTIFDSTEEEKSQTNEESEKDSIRGSFSKQNLMIRESKIRTQIFEDKLKSKLKIKKKKPKAKIEDNSEESKEEGNERKKRGFDLMILDEELKSPQFECPICCITVTMDEVFIFDCGHKFCNQCMRMSLLTKYNNGQWGFEIQCFSGDCSYMMDCFNSIPILIALIGKDKVDNMAEKAALEMATNQCAICKDAFILAEDNEITNYYCLNCDAWTCLKCGELKHEAKVCKKKWEEMKIALKDERLRCCPVCMEIYLKDDHCEHVKCHKCKTEFCYNCSAPREPILGHGGHYHRKGCKYFFKLIDPLTNIELLEDHDKLEPKCKDCQKNKKVCERPKLDLQTYYQKLGLDLENEENANDL